MLENAYKRQHKKYVVHIMNPKSMTRVCLLGHMDHDTREWFDGMLTATARRVIKEPADTHNWIICDGDIDPKSVEALNNVLDDHRLLTMHQWRTHSIWHQCEFDLRGRQSSFCFARNHQSPELTFLSEEDVDVKPLIASWIAQQPPECQGLLGNMVRFYIPSSFGLDLHGA